MLQVQWTWDLKNAGYRMIGAESQTEKNSGAEEMTVDEAWANAGNQITKLTHCRRQ
jgi:hypothetical protein